MSTLFCVVIIVLVCPQIDPIVTCCVWIMEKKCLSFIQHDMRNFHHHYYWKWSFFSGGAPLHMILWEIIRVTSKAAAAASAAFLPRSAAQLSRCICLLVLILKVNYFFSGDNTTHTRRHSQFLSYETGFLSLAENSWVKLSLAESYWDRETYWDLLRFADTFLDLLTLDETYWDMLSQTESHWV